jgi:putative ABC transport system ATP-binding protein
MVDAGIVTFDGVTFFYSQGQTIFNNLSLKLGRGIFYLIRGSSGTGKSTLLRLINRLEEPWEGEIFFKGRSLSSYHPPLLRRSILYIQQTPTVIDASVRDNLMLPFAFKNNGDLSRPDDDGLTRLLHDFHLRGVRLNENAQNLSVGQLQRICFIRGLLLSPEILLLDEPTSALDEESGKVVESMAERLCRESGSTVVMVSHKEFQPRQARFVVLKLADGQLREI